jgi:gamma-glutamylcyclotransferase (GGCT)/AIG2-like uncharacterized protein YtfP
LQDPALRTHVLGGAVAHVVGRGSVRGALYDLGEYPGLVDSADDERVPGTVLKLTDAAALTRLDAHEGVGEGLYVRRRMSVRLADGDEIQAWVYLYARPIDGRPRIAVWPP